MAHSKNAEGMEPRRLNVVKLLQWLLCAASLTGKSPLAVATALAELAWQLDRTHSLLLTPATIRRLCLSRQSGYQGLASLENAGLIVVRRKRGRHPLAKIMLAPDA